jgi:hypothetical protein
MMRLLQGTLTIHGFKTRSTYTANYTLQDGFWYTKAEQLIVPNMPSIKLSIMEEMHASPMYGHAGTTKTKKQV